MEVIASLATIKAVLVVLKELGFDPQVFTPMTVCLLFFKYETFKLRQALTSYNENNEKRFTKIETHIGLDK